MILRDMIYSKMEEYGFSRDLKMCMEIEKRLNRMKKSKNGKKYSDEYLIDYILKTFYKKKGTNSAYECKYFIDDKPSAEFARENGILPFNLNNAIHRGLKKDPKASVEIIGKSYVERVKNRFIYTCNGYPLSIACKMAGVSNDDALRIFHKEHPDKESMTDEEIDAALVEIVEVLKLIPKKEKKLGINLRL